MHGDAWPREKYSPAFQYGGIRGHLGEWGRGGAGRGLGAVLSVERGGAVVRSIADRPQATP